MTTTSSSGTLLTTDTNVASSNSSDVKSVNHALIIQTDPNGVIDDVDMISTEASSPNNDASKNTNNQEKGKPLSSADSSRDDVKEVDPRDRRLIYVACLQLILGAMSLIWASAVLTNEASLGGASAAAALIAGVAAVVGSASGLIARHSKRSNKSAHRAATASVTLAAITVAACSLVMALSATGLLRDGNKPAELVTWIALLSNTSLLLTTGLLAACAVVSGALWRRDAGICSSRGRRAPREEEPLPGTPPAPHKVSKWLGQQNAPALFMISPMPPSAGSVYSAAGSAPHIIPLHVPPPPMSPLALPPYILPPIGPTMGPCVFHGNAAMTLPDRRERRRSRKHQRRMSAGQAVAYPTDAMLEPLDETTVAEAAQRATEAAARRQRHPNALSEEEMERSYTGLDRAIAEQFITEVMEKHQLEDEEARRRVSTVSSSGRLSCSQRIEDETF